MVRMNEPDALWLLLLLLALWMAYSWALAGTRRWLSAYGGSVPHKREEVRMALVSLALGCAVLGLARLEHLRLGEECVRPDIGIACGVDVSVSMLAEDAEFPASPPEGRPPSRMERVRQEVLALTQRLEGERVGLFLFASDAAPVLHPSADYENIQFFIEHYLNSWNVSARGTNLLSSLQAAEQMLGEESKYRVLVLFTDGEHERMNQWDLILERARELRSKLNVHMYTVGVGSATYSPIPLRGASGNVEGYMLDSKGELVKTRTETALLEALARVGGGRAYQLGPVDISQQIVGDILRGATDIPLLTRPAMRAVDLSPCFFLASVLLLVAKDLVEGLRRLRPLRPGIWIPKLCSRRGAA